jgi:2'-5' RNA ligase
MHGQLPLLRSFIAIPLPSVVQQQVSVLQQQLRPLFPELKNVKTENLHLTLHFLGDQSEELLAEIGQTMLSIGQKKKIFNVELKGLGCFPNLRRPRVLWLGVEPQTELIDIYQHLAAELSKLGLTIDKQPYRPHLTIGRFKQPPKQTGKLCPFLSQSCGNITINKMILFSSKLTSQGAIHMPLTTAGLSAD